MKKRQIFWAIAFGAMLAVTGCGDSENGDGDGGSGGSGGSGATGGSGGSGGGSGSDFCSTYCNACAPDQANLCNSECQSVIGNLPGGVDIDSCPNELNAVAQCLGNNDCNSENCENQITAWATCIVGVAF